MRTTTRQARGGAVLKWDTRWYSVCACRKILSHGRTFHTPLYLVVISADTKVAHDEMVSSIYLSIHPTNIVGSKFIIIRGIVAKHDVPVSRAFKSLFICI